MNKIKILIIEDDVIIANDLKETLEKNGHDILSIARNHGDAMVAIEKYSPELILIDIFLNHSASDGIEIAREIAKNYVIPFVFLTANSEIQTFERAKLTNPAAYLLKPFRHRELVFQIELAYNHYWMNKNSENNPVKAESIFLPHKGGHLKLNKRDVLFLKASGSYVDVYVKDEKIPSLFTMNIGHLSQYFTTPNFHQISRSYIVNLDYLERFGSENIILKFHDSPIPMPHQKRTDLMKKLAIIKTPKYD